MSSADASAPRRFSETDTKTVFSAWHPLWVRRERHNAELGEEIGRPRARVVNKTQHDSDTLSGGEAAFLITLDEANVAELGPEWAVAVGSFLPNADIALRRARDERVSRRAQDRAKAFAGSGARRGRGHGKNVTRLEKRMEDKRHYALGRVETECSRT